MCIYVCLKGFLADLSYGDFYLTNNPFLKATMKSPCQELCEIPSILCFWKEQLTVNRGFVLVSFSPSLALRTCKLNNRGGPCCSVDGIEALQGSGAGCSARLADTQIKGFPPQNTCCDGEVHEAR